MSNKTYNLILNLITAVSTCAFVILKMFNIITFSWWGILIFLAINIVFRESDDDNDKEDYNKTMLA